MNVGPFVDGVADDGDRRGRRLEEVRVARDEQDPSKLKLRTTLYEVKEVKGDRYLRFETL